MIKHIILLVWRQLADPRISNDAVTIYEGQRRGAGDPHGAEWWLPHLINFNSQPIQIGFALADLLRQHGDHAEVATARPHLTEPFVENRALRTEVGFR